MQDIDALIDMYQESPSEKKSEFARGIEVLQSKLSNFHLLL